MSASTISPPFLSTSSQSDARKIIRFSSLRPVYAPHGWPGTHQPITVFSSCLMTVRTRRRNASVVYDYGHRYYRILCALATVIYLRMAMTDAPTKTAVARWMPHFIIVLDIGSSFEGF